MVRLIHSTLEQNLTVLRERFREASGERAAQIARWVLNRTDAQLRRMFGVTQDKIAALRSRLQTKVDALTTLEAQVGE